ERGVDAPGPSRSAAARRAAADVVQLGLPDHNSRHSEVIMTTSRARFLLPTLGLMLLAPLALGAQGDAKPVKATARPPARLNIVYEVRGKGDTALVFLHGWCSDRASWKHQVDAFAGDYRVVAIDLGGHGESGKDRKQWSVTGLAGDVEAVVKELGLKRVVLV